jgi:tetraacyldisaccharide 4'-kinase
VTQTLAEKLQRAWYQGSRWLVLLKPLSWLVSAVARRRLRVFRRRAARPPVPVLVVGNVTVGGTGKTPLVISLCERLQARGLRVVVISRGYGGNPPSLPWLVQPDQSAALSGDEPLMIARRTGVPVIVAPKRVDALDMAVREHDAEVVISDDGLQHYALPRSAEIIVLDAQRMLGNGACLPAGPLREPAQRLNEVDWVVVNGQPDKPVPEGAVVMTLHLDDPVNLLTGERLPIEDFIARFPLVDALAGIGNPQRFFASLQSLGLVVREHGFADHHAFTAEDFAAFGSAPVLMTEKDAVKCAAFAEASHWYMPVSVQLPNVFFDAVFEKLIRSRQ